MLHHYRRGQACPKMCNLPYMHYRSAFICLPSSPVRSAHLHASAVGLAIFLGWQCPSLELHCHCHASGILRQQSHGLNRFPCPETWAERSLGAAHLLPQADGMHRSAALCYYNLWLALGPKIGRTSRMGVTSVPGMCCKINTRHDSLNCPASMAL